MSLVFKPTASGTRAGSLTVGSMVVSLTGTGGSTITTPVAINTSTLANGTVGSSYSAALTATGGTSPYKWSLASGSLPAGLALSTSGTISGTPTAAVASSFAVTVKDSAASPQAATATLKLTVAAAPVTPNPVTPAPSTGSSSLATAYAAYIAANYSTAKGYTTQYYVSTTGSDSNPGTSASPWATVAHADSASADCSVIWFEPGTWTAASGSRLAHTTSSGTANCHKAFVSTTYGGAIFSAPTNSSDGDMTIWSDGEYVDWVGFNVSGLSCSGLYTTGQYNRIVYNQVHDIDNTSSAPACGNGTGGGGIDFGEGNGANDTILNNFIWNVGYGGNDHVHGIYLTMPGVTVQNNVVYNVTGGCIQAYHAPANDIITNNTLTDCLWGYVVGGDSTGPSGIVFNNNIVANNTQYGIYECGASSCGVAMGSGNTYENNITYSNSNEMEGGTLANNSTANPNFVKYASPASGGNFALSSGSPAIDTGTAPDAASGNILGATTNDIGAY